MMANGKPFPENNSGPGSDENFSAEPAPPRDTFLERVVQETMVNQQSLGSDDLKALQGIARRYPDADLTVDPIGVELVGSILQRRVSANVLSPQVAHEIATAIAQSLFENPDTCERLQGLWRQLCESVR